MKKNMTVQNWLKKIHNLDVYSKQTTGIAIKQLETVRRHPMNVIDVDREEIIYDSDSDGFYDDRPFE